MAEEGKKVEVRFGAFTCSIEGYDNPVEQMREILGMMQRMITETPALAEADRNFDASRLEDAIANERSDAPTPGIVVIRNAEATDDNNEQKADPAASDRPETVSEAVEAEAEDAEAVFEDVQPSQDNAVESDPVSLSQESDEQNPDHFEQHSEAFAEELHADPEQHDDSHAFAESDDQGEPLVSTQTSTAEDRSAEADVGLVAAFVSDEAVPASLQDHLESNVTEEVPEPAADISEQSTGETDTTQSGPAQKSRLTDRIRNIFAAPERAPRPDPVNIFASPASGAAAPVQTAAAEFEERIEDPVAVYNDALNSSEQAPEEEPSYASDRFAPDDDPEPDAFGSPQSASAAPRTTIQSIFAPPPIATKPEPIKSIFAPPPVQPATSATAELLASLSPQVLEPNNPTIDPADAAPEPERNEADQHQSRFQAMLNRVHGASPVTAPGISPLQESTASHIDTEDGSTSTEQLTAQDLATRAGDPSVAGQLEASAAWLTLVQNQSRFSRREVMGVLETIEAEQPRALADRIKGFGKLVRSGTLILVDDGVFALTQSGRDRFQALLAQD